MTEQPAQKRISEQDRALLGSLPIEVLASLTAGTTDTGVTPSTEKGDAVTGRSGHRMRVRLLEATGLPATTYFATNKSDTYAILGLQGSKTRVTSRVVRETTTPIYNEAWDFHLSPRPQEDILYLTLYACHTIGRDDFLGRVEVPLCMVLAMPPPRKLECWFKLLPESSNFYVNDKTGSIRLGFEYFFDPSEGQLALLRHQALAFAQIDASRGRLPSAPFAPSAIPPPLPSSVSYSPPSVPFGGYPGYPSEQLTAYPAPAPLSPSASPFAPQPYPTAPLTAQPPPLSSSSEPQEPCPVCNQAIATSKLAAHVEAHFPSQPSRGGQPQSQQSQLQQQPEGKTIIPPPARYQPTIPAPGSGPYPLGYPPMAAAGPASIPPYSFPQPPTPLPSPAFPLPLSATTPPPPPPTYASLRMPPGSSLPERHPHPDSAALSELEARELAQALRESEEAAGKTAEQRPPAAALDPNLTQHEAQLMESLSQRLAQSEQAPIHEASPAGGSIMAGWNPAPAQRVVPSAALYPSVTIPLSYPTQPSH